MRVILFRFRDRDYITNKYVDTVENQDGVAVALLYALKFKVEMEIIILIIIRQKKI